MFLFLVLRFRRTYRIRLWVWFYYLFIYFVRENRTYEFYYRSNSGFVASKAAFWLRVDIFCVLSLTSSKILWRHPFAYFYFPALSGSAEDKKLCDGEDLPVSSTNDQLPDSTKRASQV